MATNERPFRTFRPTVLIDTRKKAFADLDTAARLSAAVPASLDTEYDPKHLDPDQKPVVFSYSHGRGERKVVFGEYATSVYADWICDKRFKKVYSDFTADCRTFKSLGLDVRASYHADIVPMDWLVNENNPKHGLKDQVYRYLHRERLSFGDTFCYPTRGKSGKFLKKLAPLRASQVCGLRPLPDEALEVMSAEDWFKTFVEYSGDDGEDTIILFGKHKKTLVNVGYWPTYLRLDRPFLFAVMQCEDSGILMDQEKLRAIHLQAHIDETRSTHAFRAHVGRPDLNLNSKPQMKELLMEDMGWPAYDDLVTKKTGEYQMTKAVAKRWLDEGIDLAWLLARRETKRKLASDVKGLLAGISPDGRLRTDINPIGAISGRVSSRKWEETHLVEKTDRRGNVTLAEKKTRVGANLLNIVGRGEKDPYGIRTCFVAPKKGQMTARGTLAKEDHKLIVVDEAGFELVISIEFASRVYEGSEMYAVMQEAGSPSAVHALTAIRILGVKASMKDWKSVKDDHPDQYKLAKVLNFSLGYGGDEYTLSQKLGLDSRNEEHIDTCKRHVDRFFEAYPEIVALQEWAIDHGYKHGWVPTISGRRQHVGAGLASIDKYERKHWENKCTNSVIQGSAADILKMAMVSIYNDQEMSESGYTMLVQVYDELVGESPASTAEENLEKVKYYMEAPYHKEMSVKLVAEGKIADNWQEGK